MSEALEIELVRDKVGGDTTLGSLRADGQRLCWTLEDRVRPAGEAKVPGATAIPAGRYQVRITWSPRFKCQMPLLLNVPGFDGVRIHPGNTAADTDGCVLVGLDRFASSIGRSRDAYGLIFPLLDAAEREGRPVWLTITEA